MKTPLALVAALSVVAASSHRVHAGDREWATAGKILTGVAAAGLVHRILEPAPVYHETMVRYVSPPPVVYVPAPPPTVIVRTVPTVVYHEPVYVPVAPVRAAPARVIHLRSPRVVVKAVPQRHHHHHHARTVIVCR